MGFEEWKAQNAQGSSGFEAWKAQIDQPDSFSAADFDVPMRTVLDPDMQEQEFVTGQAGKGPAGLLEMFFKDPIKFLPVGGPVGQAIDKGALIEAAHRLEKDDYGRMPGGVRMHALPMGMAAPHYEAMKEAWTPDKQQQEDAELVGQWIDEARDLQERGVSFGGKVGAILGEMPAFITEAAMTAGASSGARVAGRELLERALKKKAQTKLGKAAVAVGSRVGSAATRTALTPGRVGAAFTERQMPQGLSFSEEGQPVFQWSDENPATSFAKAWGDVTIEWFSEEFGDLELTPKVASAVFKRLKGKKYAGKIVDKLYKGYKKIKPDATKLDFVNKAFAVGGIHGMVDEVGEEYLGAALRSVTGVSDQNLGEAMWEQVRETPAMLTAFSVMPAAKWSLASLAGKPFDWSQLEGEEHPGELSNWYDPTPRVMPKADVDDAVADTVVASEFHPEGPRKLKEVMPEEQQVLDRLEEEEVKPEPVEGEEQGTVAPNLYIGSVTGRAKAAWAEMLAEARQAEGMEGEVAPEDIGSHTEGGFPTKRTGVEMSRAEAQETLAQTEEALDERLEVGEWVGQEIALMKAMWGDIRELRTSLGQDVGRMPFKTSHSPGQRITVEIRNPTERIYAAIRGPSKKTLAQYDHKQLVTQSQAVKAKLKAVARAASRAYRQGSKEAVAKLRLHLRALKAKQRTLRMVRDYRAKMVEQIVRPVSDGVDPLYAKAIRTMSGAMDVKERSGATQRWLAGLERELKAVPRKRGGKVVAGPEIAKAMKSSRSLELLKRLSQVPLEHITTEQLQEIAAERIRLENEGKLENLALQRKRSAAPATRALIDQLKDVKDRSEMGARQYRNAGWWRKMADGHKKGFMHYALGEYRLRRLFEWLDGMGRGSFTKLVWEPIKRLSTESSIKRNQRTRDYHDFLKSQGVDAAYFMGAKDTFTLENGEALKLSKFEQIGVYVFAQDEGSRSHLTETAQQRELRAALDGGQITEEQFYRQWYGESKGDMKELKGRYELDMEARQNLGLSDADVDTIAAEVKADEQMKAVADYMTDQLNERWESILQVSRAVGMDPTELVKVGKYLPLLIRNLDYAKQDDLLRRALGAFIPEDYLAEKKFLKERKHAKQDIELDAQMLFLHSISEVEHFLTMTPMLSQLSHVLADDEFRRQLDRKTRGYGTQIVSQWVVDSARGRIVREQGWVAQRLHKLNRHGIIYALGYNVPVVLRQSISSLNAMAMSPRMIPHFIQSVVMNNSPWSFDAMKKEIFAKSPLVRERSMEHVWAQPWNKKGMKKAALRASGHPIRGAELSRAATAAIRAVDLWTVLHSWKAAYDTALDQGASDEAAVRYADDVIQKTQPMARPEDLPHFFRGGILEQWANLFRNQINQNINFWVHDIYGMRKHGKITNAEVAYRVMMSYMLPAVVFGMIGRGFAPPEDEKELATDVLMYAGGAPLLMGKIVQGAVRGWGTSFGMSEMAFTEPAKAIGKAQKGDMIGVLKHAAATVAMWKTPGMPTAQMLRSVEGAMALDAGDTDDTKRLIWSEWALKQGGDESEGKSNRRSVSGSGKKGKRRSISR